jgi:protein TonB
LKRFLAISIILHVLVVVLALLLAPQKEKEARTMTAVLVPPEIRERPAERPKPAQKTPRPRIRRQDPVRTGETGTPKRLFAVPKGKKIERSRTASRQSDNRRPQAARPAPMSPAGKKPAEMTTRDKLFDRAVIGKTARAGRGRARSVSSGGVTFNVGQGVNYGWVQRLSEKVSSYWSYPPELWERRIFSDVYVRMTFRRDGRLVRAELVRTSGYRSLDDSAFRALKDAAPYWPLPDDWKEDELTIVGRFYVP